MRHATDVTPDRLRADDDAIRRLQRVRVVAGLALVSRDPDDPMLGDEDRFCGCGNLLYPGLVACGEREPVALMHTRYTGTWRVGLAGGRCP